MGDTIVGFDYVEIPCSFCGGNGVVMGRWFDSDPAVDFGYLPVAYLETCMHCYGTGRLNGILPSTWRQT